MATYKLIASSVASSGSVATIEFTSIPQTYTDLVVKFSGKSSGSGFKDVQLYFNSSTANLTGRQLFGDGSAAYSELDNTYGNHVNIPGTTYANTFGSAEWYIPNYTSSNYKSFCDDGCSEANISSGIWTGMQASLWSSTAAITTITLKIIGTATNLGQYSSAYLYGISNA